MTTDAVPSRHVEIALATRDNRAIATRLVMLVAGLLLFFAAAMKWRQLPVVGRMGDDLLHRPWFVGGQIIFEAGLAAWLISGFRSRWSRRVALAAFGVFACAALYEAFGGAASCGCFGEFKVNPWITFGVDLAFAGALGWSIRNWQEGLPAHPGPLAGATRVSPIPMEQAGDTSVAPTGMEKMRGAVLGACLLAIIGLTAWRYSQALAVEKGGGGIIFTVDGVAVLDTDNWIGKPLPIASYLEHYSSPAGGDSGSMAGTSVAIGHGRDARGTMNAGFNTGAAMLLIYSDQCDHCRAAVPRYLAWVKGTAAAPRFWFVEMPPYASANEALVSPADGVDRLRLSDKQEWFAQTPVLVKLENGVVTQVLEGQAAEDPKFLQTKAQTGSGI